MHKGEALASYAELLLYQLVRDSHEGQALMAAMPEETRTVVRRAIVFGWQMGVAKPDSVRQYLYRDGAMLANASIKATRALMDAYDGAKHED